MATWDSAIDDTGYYMGESFDVDAAFLTPRCLLDAADAMNNASNAVAAEDVRFRTRVDQASMPPMYVILYRWDEVQAYATNVSRAWPYQTTKSDQFDAFADLYAELNMTALNEPGQTIDDMHSDLFPSN